MKRLFVVDPVCAQDFGHNLAALHYFVSSARASGVFDAVLGYCAETLKGRVDQDVIIPYFNFNYHHIFNIKPATIIDGLNVQSDRDYILRSKGDFSRLFAEMACGAEDTIFFPSADFYAIMGVLMTMRSLSKEKCPRIIFRMIGVLEYTSRIRGVGETDVIALMRECLAAGFPVEVVAETPAYATELSLRLDTVVHVTPYPVIDELAPIDPDAPLIVAALGSGRYDKGFLRLKSILKLVVERADTMPVRFVVQNLPQVYAEPFVRYISELSALPGMLLADSVLSQQRLSDWLRRARVIVTPYAQDVYALRGSAMLMEALSVGRPNVSEADCGFSSQLAYYDCGKLCTTDEEYATAILDYLRMDISELNSRLAQARARFVFDSNSAYARLWQ